MKKESATNPVGQSETLNQTPTWKRAAMTIASVLMLCLAVFVLLNWQFFYIRAQHAINPPQPQEYTHTTETTPTLTPNTLYIPSLEITAPIQYITETNERAFQAALKSGVVHFPNTAKPGEAGNVYIFGHSSDYAWSKGDYKTIFALLPKINPGDAIHITNEQGQQYIYIVTTKFVVEPTDLSVLNQSTNGKKLLTLQTSYPLGTALRRYIVTAELQ